MRKIVLVALLAALFACQKNGAKVEKPQNEFVNICDFQNLSMVFNTPGPCIFEKTENPIREGINNSSQCGMLTCGGEKWEFIYSNPHSRKFDFTKNEPIFKLKVLAPKAGAKVYLKLEPANISADMPSAIEVQDVLTTKSGEWEELVFDFSEFEPQSNVYQKLVLVFDAGEYTSKGEKWYFDDIMCPSDDLTSICLFQRYEGNPVFVPDGGMNWRGAHMANAAIITPDDAPDGNWWLYIRGTGSSPEWHDQIGLYKQDAADFNPFGPWKEYEHNPVIGYGERGSYDEMFLLDGCPVVGRDGVFYVYYKARRYDYSVSLGLACSQDGYNFTKMPQPAIMGATDALFYKDKYYVFAGDKVYVSDEPQLIDNYEVYPTIKPGGGPSNFDSLILWGAMVFRLKGVDKWFMTYQASAVHPDFPDRFHLAVSDDLLNWTKVDNQQPLFTRGSRGQWDQGGIWYPEVIEYKDKLYLYYEGWGREGFVQDRDIPYFDGRSCTGVAWAYKKDFLKWCGL